MAEPERFKVEERTEFSLRDSLGDRWPLMSETQARSGQGRRREVDPATEVVSRRVFVLTGEWQPVAPKVGLPEPTCGAIGKYGFGPCLLPGRSEHRWHVQADGKQWDDAGQMPLAPEDERAEEWAAADIDSRDEGR